MNISDRGGCFSRPWKWRVVWEKIHNVREVPIWKLHAYFTWLAFISPSDDKGLYGWEINFEVHMNVCDNFRIICNATRNTVCQTLHTPSGGGESVTVSHMGSRRAPSCDHCVTARGTLPFPSWGRFGSTSLPFARSHSLFLLCPHHPHILSCS